MRISADRREVTVTLALGGCQHPGSINQQPDADGVRLDVTVEVTVPVREGYACPAAGRSRDMTLLLPRPLPERQRLIQGVTGTTASPQPR